jgi:hypothetical protein
MEQFQSSSHHFDSNQEEISHLRFLFLHHLSLHHTFQKEEKEIDYEFQIALDNIFQNEENNFETFFGSSHD